MHIQTITNMHTHTHTHTHTHKHTHTHTHTPNMFSAATRQLGDEVMALLMSTHSTKLPVVELTRRYNEIFITPGTGRQLPPFTAAEMVDILKKMPSFSVCVQRTCIHVHVHLHILVLVCTMYSAVYMSENICGIYNVQCTCTCSFSYCIYRVYTNNRSVHLHDMCIPTCTCTYTYMYIYMYIVCYITYYSILLNVCMSLYMCKTNAYILHLHPFLCCLYCIMSVQVTGGSDPVQYVSLVQRDDKEKKKEKAEVSQKQQPADVPPSDSASLQSSVQQVSTTVAEPVMADTSSRKLYTPSPPPQPLATTFDASSGSGASTGGGGGGGGSGSGPGAVGDSSDTTDKAGEGGGTGEGGEREEGESGVTLRFSDRESQRLASETQRLLQCHQEHAMTVSELVQSFEEAGDPALPRPEELSLCLHKHNVRKGSKLPRLFQVYNVLYMYTYMYMYMYMYMIRTCV